jgi:ferredoxin-NADP reductase
MAHTLPPVGPWQHATIKAIRRETIRAKTFSLDLAIPTPHIAGQHFVIRLTAPDGYTAQRSYSVASPPSANGREVELTVERLDGGEVSTFLHDELVVGDTLEVRGPIGGWFVWDGSTPALLVGGGSGVVPLMAMLRLARQQPNPTPVHLVVSTRTRADLYYADELRGDNTTIVYTRAAPPESLRPAGRLTADDLRPHALKEATVFVCGSASFAAAVGELATDIGFDPSSIRVERFGPSG